MEILNASMLLVMLLNPFLVILYLIDLVKKQKILLFSKNLAIAGFYSLIVFMSFAVAGDIIFKNILQVNFASFQVFGGIIFLIIGVQFVFKGSTAIDALRGDNHNVSGAIAMPILIGPGTISASVLIGKKLSIFSAIFAISVTLTFSIVIMIILKIMHDYIHDKKAKFIERYIEVAGRILALYIGTVAIEMIMKGVQSWITFISKQ